MTTQPLDKDKILTTVSRQILYNCILSGMSIKDASKEAKLDYTYGRKLATKWNINALAKQTTAKLSEKCEIRIIDQQLELVSDIAAAREAGCWGAVMSGRATLLKSIGGMTGDRPHPDALAGKAKDAQLLDKMREFADRYYGDKYLAKPAEEVTVLDLIPLAGPGGEDNSQKDTQTGDTDNGTNSSGTGKEVS